MLGELSLHGSLTAEGASLGQMLQTEHGVSLELGFAVCCHSKGCPADELWVCDSDK